MSKTAALYTLAAQTIQSDLTSRIDSLCQQASSPTPVFFRADDIGIPSLNFQKLITSFLRYKLPLCLATVPTWLTEKRLTKLQNITGKNSSQWCWHQHGYQHRNFEEKGKKQEFGPARSEYEIRRSLRQGKERLEKLLGPEFQPIFTPPWNRCSAVTIRTLAELNFKALSRSDGAEPQTITTLPDIQVNVDLHTRKEQSATIGFTNLLNELEQGVHSGHWGIMIHHQRMNSRAFDFLDILLEKISHCPSLVPVLFNDFLPAGSTIDKTI